MEGTSQLGRGWFPFLHLPLLTLLFVRRWSHGKLLTDRSLRTQTENLANLSTRKGASMDLYTFQKIGLKDLDTIREAERDAGMSLFRLPYRQIDAKPLNHIGRQIHDSRFIRFDTNVFVIGSDAEFLADFVF